MMIKMSASAADGDALRFKEPDFAYPQDVIKQAQSLLKSADGLPADKAGVTRLRAVIELCSARSRVDGDSVFAFPAMIESVIGKTRNDAAAEAMLTLYEASVYNTIYGGDPYKYDRVDAPLEPYPADVSEWSGEQFRTVITALLKRGLELANGTPLSRFESSVEYSKEALLYLPTVKDFARYFAINIYNDISRADHLYTAEIASLVDGGISTAAAGSAPYFYWSVRKCALDRESQYTALEDIYRKSADVEAARYVLQAMCGAQGSSAYMGDYVAVGEEPCEEPVPDADAEDDWLEEAKAAGQRAELMTLLEKSLNDFPKWYGNKSFRNALGRLRMPRVRVTMPDMVMPGKAFDVNCRYSYVKSVKLTVYSIPAGVSGLYADKVLQGKYPVVATASFTPEPGAAPNGKFSRQFTLNTPGRYAIVTVVDGKTKSAESNKVYVTPLLGLVATGTTNTSAVAVDFETGAPLKGVPVTLYQHSSDENNKRVSLGRTSGDGFLSFESPRPGKYWRNYLIFSYKGIQYDLDGGFGVGVYRPSGTTTRESAVVFTDRAIYHPGDSVQWAVVAYKTGGRSEQTLKDCRLRLVLNNANNEKVDTAEVVTDAHGRAYGAFKTVKGVLTGYWSISVYESDADCYVGNGGFTVSDFKAPQIKMEVTAVRRDAPAKNDVTIEGRVATYSGMPVAGAKVAAAIQAASRWRWFVPQISVGSVDAVTDDTGNFSVVVPASMLTSEAVTRGGYTGFIASLTATSQTAETAETSTNFSIGKPYSLYAKLPSTIDVDKPANMTFNAYDGLGKETPLALRWSVSRLNEKTPLLTGDCTAGVPVDLDLSSLEAAGYELTIAPVDTLLADSYRAGRFFAYSIRRNAVPDTGQPIFIPGKMSDKGELTVGNNVEKLYIYTFVQGDSTIHQSKLHRIGRGFSTIKVDLPRNCESCRVFVATVYSGKTYVYDYRPEVKKKDVMEIRTETFRDKLVPGAGEQWRFRITGGNKSIADAAMIATMYNQALDALSEGSWPGGFNLRKWYCFMTLSQMSTDTRINWVILPPRSLDVPVVRWPEFRYPMMCYGRNRVMYRALQKSAATAMMDMAEEPEYEPAIANGVAEAEDAAIEEIVTVGYAKSDSDKDGASDDFAYRESEVLQAFWKPALVSDADGNVDIVFTVPNANGTWRMRGFAWTDSLQSAVCDLMATANKPVMVQPALPRFLRQGDTGRILATVFNNSDAQAVISTTADLFDIASGEVLRTVTSVDTVAAMGSAIVGIDVEAPTTAASIGYRVRSASGAFTDGEQSAIPVLEAAGTVIESTEFYLNPSDDKPFSLTVKAKDDAQLTLQYCQNPVWTVVKAMRGISASESLTSGGLVSKLFSALAGKHIVEHNPDIASALRQWSDDPSEQALESMLSRNETLKQLVLNQTPWVQTAASQTARMKALADLLSPENTTAGIARFKAALSKLQNQDGGFRWGPWSDRSSYWATEKVLTTLGIARSLGMLDNSFDQMLTRAFDYLQAEIVKPQTPKTDFGLTLISTFFPNFRLTPEVDGIVRRTVGDVAAGWKKYGTLDKAYSILILAGNGRRAEASSVLESIRQYGVVKPGMGLCFPSMTDVRGYATVIQAYAVMDAPKTEIDAMRQWVIVRAQATDDLGAYNPDYIIAAVLLTGSDWTSVPVGQSVTVNGAPLAIDSVESASGYFSQPLPATGKVEITVKPNGVTPSYGSVISIGREPMASVKARPGRDLSIEKRFLVERDGQWVETSTFALGERVRVQLTVKARRDLEYVSIADERAASFEPVDQLPGYVWAQSLSFYRENLDASTRLFISYLPKGTYQLTFDMTAALAGTFASGIATLQSQYAPELTAHSGGTTVTVK